MTRWMTSAGLALAMFAAVHAQTINGIANQALTVITEAALSLSDVTTANASTSQHGFLKKLDNNAAHYMDGQGNWTTPAGGSAPTAGDGISVSSTTVTWNPLDTTIVAWVEEFLTASSSSYVGSHWLKNNVAGTNTFSDLGQSTLTPAAHPGIAKIVAGSSSPAQGNGIWIAPANPTFTTAPPGANMESVLEAIIYPVSVANVRIRLAWISTASVAVPQHLIGIRFDTNTTYNDTHWMAETCSSGTCSTIDTGSTPTAAWHLLKVRRVVNGVGGNATIYFSVDGGTEKTVCSSGCDGTGNVPSTSQQLLPGVQLLTDTAASKTMEVDMVGIFWRGLTRY